MGIVRLSQYLSKRFPHLFKRKTHEALANKSYAVDASSTMYSFLVKTICIYFLNKPFLRITV